ncbi:MAG: hypothetical protein LBQ87_02175 [Candidatus Fibromonas sp.]|jgi:hypothetical protein|nr:hypothetical protein [Candidatus Fibromonas sp.]
MANKDNAHDGQKTELMIKNSICNLPNVIDILKEKFKIKGDFDNAARCGIYGEKADVRIAFDSGHYFQRKGGDGNNKKYPKTNLKHPSNNVQMKLKIDNAFLENLKLAEYNMAYKC